MNLRSPRAWLTVALATCGVAAPSAVAAPGPPATFVPVGTYSTGLAGLDAEGEVITAGETAAVQGDRLFVANATDNSLDIVDIRDVSAPVRIARIDLSPYGAGPNSVDVDGNLVAVAVEAADTTRPGAVVFFRPDGAHVATVPAGALPDMLAFNPAGSRVLVANEGEPNSYGEADSVDPEGSLTLIDVASLRGRDPRPPAVRTIRFTAFDEGAPRNDELPAGIRLNGPGATVAQDLEPEYVTWSADGRTAWVTLQEANAIAAIDVRRARVSRIAALAPVDHSQVGSGIDASDRDDLVDIRPRPVLGLPMPDAVASFRLRGRTYLVTANEGDARDYDGFSDEARVSSRTLDPAAFPDGDVLKRNEEIGRLNVSATDGVDGTGAHTELYSYGTRSATVWDAAGRRVGDTGDQFERTVADVAPANFNASNDDNDFDDRSDNKGPEPEGVDVGRVGGRQYAFVGLERAGGFMVVDVTDPRAPAVVQWATNRDFTKDPTTTDNGPEIVRFIAASRGRPARVMVSNEVSGTVTFYEARVVRRTGTTLTLLHNNDGESSILPITNTTPTGPVDTGGVAAYKTVLDREARSARTAGNSVVNVYAGDAFLASSTLACTLPPAPPTTPVYDAVAQRQMGYDAHILGNHEFDFGPAYLRRFIDGFAQGGRPNSQPFLSSNLDVTGEPALADIRDADGLIIGSSTDGKVVARSLIHVDPATGQTFGIVGATTPLLPTISSPGGVRVTTTDIPSTAVVVQREIDRLRARGVNKIVLVSHLQDVANDRDLVSRLTNLDIAVAGGGDELLANPDTALLPGETQAVAGAYPLLVTAADGRQVPVVTTAGNYKYLGRLDVRFDAQGRVAEVLTSSGPRRVIPTVQAAPGVIDGVTDAVAPNAGIVNTVVNPVQACLTGFSQPILNSEVVLDTSRAGNRSRETNAGNTIGDAYLASYDRYASGIGLPPRGADNPTIAIQNGGGIRQGAGNAVPPAAPGTISRRNTLDVLAFFTNAMTVVRDVTPADLKQIFERSGASLPGEGGQFLQVAGLTVTYSLGGTAQVITVDGTVTTPGSRVVDITLADGRKIVENGAVVPGAPNVAIVTNSFTADGGDNYPWLAANTNTVNLGATYEQAWVEYLLALPPTTIGGATLPTISASNPDYATANPARRIVIQP